MSRKTSTHFGHGFLKRLFVGGSEQRRLRQHAAVQTQSFGQKAGSIGELLEDRMLLAGVNDDPTNPAWQHSVGEAAAGDVLSLLASVEDITVAQATDASSSGALASIGQSLNQLLTDSGGKTASRDALRIHASVADFISSSGAGLTVHGLASKIDAAVQPFGGQVDVDLVAVSAGLLDLQIVVDQSTTTDVDVAAVTPKSAMQNDLDISGSVPVEVEARFQADVSLNVSLLADPGRPEAALQWDHWQASADFSATGGTTVVDYHFAELTSDTVTAVGEASVSATLTDPTPGTPGILKSELAAASSGADLLVDSQTGILQFQLPLSTDLTGFTIPAGHNPAVTITDNTLFDSDSSDATTSISDFSSLQHFVEMDAARFQSSLESVISALNEVDASALLNAEIALTNGRTLNELIDVSDIFTQQVLAGLVQPGSLELSVSDNVTAWAAITDGSLSVAVDGETLTLHDVDFSAATNMFDVASILETAINAATTRVPDVVVDFDILTSRTDNDGNTSNVHTLTITSTGITSGATVTSPAVVIVHNADGDDQIVGTSLIGEFADHVVDAEGAVVHASRPVYGNAQKFRDTLRTLTNGQIADVVFVPATGTSPATLRFDVSIDETLDAVRTSLNLPDAGDELSHLVTQSTIDLTPRLQLSTTIDVELGPVGGDFVLTTATTLAAVNAGRGIRLNRDRDAADPSADGETDVKVNLRDASTFEVNFDGAVTVGDIIDLYNNHAANTGGNGPNGRKLTVSIAADQQSLSVTDHTDLKLNPTDTESTIFSIKPINGSLASYGLGLAGTAATEDDDNTADVDEATTIQGAALHGLTATDHILMTDLSIQPSVALLAQDLTATAQHGFVEIDLTQDSSSNHSAVSGTFGQVLSYGNVGVSAGTLIDDLNADVTLGTSTVGADVDLHLAAAVNGRISTDIEIDAATVTGTVNVPNGTSQSDYITDGATASVTLNDAEELKDLAAASFTDIVSSLDDLGGLIGDFMKLDAFNLDLPLLSISVSDLASIGEEIGAIAESLASNPSTSLQQVEELIEDALGLADIPGASVFALPELNTAAGRSYLNRVPEHFQPARLAAGDPVSQSLRTLDYLATQQHDSPEVGLTIDRSLVTRNVSDYSGADLQALLDQHGITLPAGASSFEVPGFTLRLDFEIDFAASDSEFAARLDADPDTAGVQVPLHFALEDFGLNLPSVIDVSGESMITVDVGTTLQLSMGLDLTDPNGVTPFVYEYDADTQTGTTILASLTAIADDITFRASIGPFGAAIDGGTLALTSSDPFSDDFDASHTPAAEFRLELVAGDNVGDADGRLTIAEALAADAADLVTTNVAAFAFAELPAFFPTADNHVGDFKLAADLSSLTSYFADSSGHNTNSGSNGLSVSVTDSSNQPVFTASMPQFESFDLSENLFALVGGWEGVFDVIIGAMQGEVLGVHIPLIGDALADEARWLEDIRDTVVDTFGAADGSNPTLDMITSVLYSALGPDGVNLLIDANEDERITVEDIGLELTTGTGSIVTGVLFHLPLGRNDELLSESIAFDLGVPGLGLEVDGDVRLEADFRLDLGIGLSVEDGVYIDTSADNELELSIEATIPGLTAKGALGFLQLDVSDDATHPSHVGASFKVDLRDVVDGNGNTDNRLTLSEMFTASPADILSATVEAEANVNLDLVASFGGDADFPRLRSDLLFEWDFTRTFGAGSGTVESGAAAPTLRFDNVGLSLGEFINQFVSPIVEQARKVTEPIQPILDALNSEVPVVSQILAGATWLDLAEMFGGAEVKPFVEALEILDQVTDVVDRLNGTDNDIWIDLGSFTVFGKDAINPDMAGQLGIGSSSNPAVELADQLIDKGAAAFNDLLNDATREVISFPLLEHPTNAFQLLLGHDVDLVVFDFPELTMGFNMAYRMVFPPFPILYAELGGGVTTTINFDFGYDTAGLRKFSSTLDPLDLVEGFYISDRANANGTGADIPEAAFTGYIYVQGGLDAGIFQAGVRGQLSATVDFNLHDYPDEFSNQTDGKVRADELIRSLKLSPPPIHIFDIDGSIDAALSAFLKIDLGLFTVSKTFKIASVRLLDFSVPRPAEDRPLLATKNGHTLTLNMTDAADHYVVMPGTDPNDSNRVVVRGFRPDGKVIDTRGFAGITQIVGLGSAGADIVEIDTRLQQTVELHGGNGNDRFTAGGGRTAFYGDAGDDVLIGGSANDVLDGGDGDDQLLDLQGHNTLRGGAGNDYLTAGRGRDLIEGGDGDDTVLAGAGHDEVHGGSGDDTIHGEDGNDRLFGDAGDDVIIGANGRDWLDGGADNDRLEGGMLADTLIGGSGDDFIDGGVANDLIYGNAIGTIQLATGFYNDSGSGNNTIVAAAGSDRISTGTGNDNVYAGSLYSVADSLSNIIHAAGGDNVIVGDAGNNSIVTGPGADTITTRGSDDLIISGAGDDTINSGEGNDVVVGGFGDDDITTVSGRNIVWGGLLPSTLSGINPTSTTLAEKAPQVVAAFNGTLRATVTAWAFDGVVPANWTAAEAANLTGFDVPTIMPRGMNGFSLEGTPLDGNDTISTGPGDDVIFGGSDQDLIHGGDGNDFIDAGAGNDEVFGGDGRDVLLGGANNDRIFGNAGIDQVYGGFGDDTLFAGAGETIPVNGASQHSLAGQRTWGGDGVDYLYAYAQVGNAAPAGFVALETSLTGDEMHGGSGGDFLFGNLRSEILSGGDGNDSIFGDWLAGPETPAGAEDGFPFENTHKATVGGNDLLLGGSGEDTLTGGGGDDALYGGADSDRLEGQDGVDSLFGGDWIDLLVLDVSPHYAVNGSADNVDGHGPAAPNVFTTDDNATDILVIEGDADRLPGNIDSTNDTIQVGQDGSGQLVVLYNGRVIEARWLDAFAKPLVEQFELDGLTGNDHLEFLTAPVTVTGPDNQPLVVRPLDVSRLSDRSDFVGVLNGGPGDDVLRGTAARDRIDGSSGSDTLFGFAGDDRLFGGSDGSANDHDVMYAGQGNDDLIGGLGSNEIFAWTQDPKSGAQFGLFVNANGELVSDNGDLDGDGFLDADGVSRPLQPENTGLNRMLGNLYEDDLYGGTGLDFIFGNGGNDRTFRADGTLFSSTDQDLGGDSWVQYARENSGVWYVGGSAREDIIQLNYVTEEGLLSGRHVVTRSTTIVDQNGVPRSTFDVSANLNFGATDSDGNLIWDASQRAWDSTTNSFADDSISLSNLLPPEGVIQAVIIDALGGDDTVIVGETVQATVWVSAGAGNDYVEIKSGNALLPDETEAGSRNDSLDTAFELNQPELPAVLTADVAAPANGVLDAESNFTVKINDNAPIAVKVTQAAIHGIDGSYANENIDDLLFDINAALTTAGQQNAVMATRHGDRILFVSTDRGDDAKLRIRADSEDPIVRQLGFVSDFVGNGTSSTSEFTYNELTIDGIYDKDFYRIHLAEETGENAAVSVNSATLEDGLTVSVYQAADGADPRMIAVNADAWERDGQANNSASTAHVLEDVQTLLGIQGLTLTTAADVDYFRFTTDSVGRRTDRVSIRQTDGDALLIVSLTDAAGNSIAPTIKDGSDNLVQEFSLEDIAAGTFTLRISSAAAARYELIPSIGTVGTRIENLNTGAASSVSLASLDAGTYFIEVATPNALPTVYNMSFDLDLQGAISVPAIGLADTNFHVDRRDVVTGGDGHDVLIGGLGEDWIFGGDGNDVLSGGLDQQASDLLFGGAGSDTFQLLPDQLPNLHGSNQTFVPTFNDRFDGGDGEDRILYLGGDYTTNPITGASVAIPDYVSMRFNTQLHRYEFTSLQWDVANERFAVAEDGNYRQHYAFFQATNIEATVIDGQAGDDVVRADGEYKFPNTDSEWGVKRGNAQQGGTLGALTLEGGDGNDVLFGGDLNDIIDGGSGNDIIVGGLGDDLLFGGGGNDYLAGQHAGEQTPTFTDDDIAVRQLTNPNVLAAMNHVPVYRALPIATTGLRNENVEVATVQDGNASLDDAATLNVADANESITGISAVGDLNADDFDDFVVSTNLKHYVFFGPVDLTSLTEIAARSAVDPHNFTGRADVLIDIAVGDLVGGIANVNGDYTGGSSVQAVNDLVFAKQTGNIATINVLFGGASIRDGEADTFWPRSIGEFNNLDPFNWRSVNVTLPTDAPASVELLNYTRSDATDVMLVATSDSSVIQATVVSGATITGWDTQGSVNGTTVEPTTTFHLSIPGQTAASIQTVGDMNGDGLHDVAGVIAARPEIGEAGQVFIHYARPASPVSVDLSAGYDRLITDDYLAGSLTKVGDLNSDGYDDVMLQRLQFDPATANGGNSQGQNGNGTSSDQNQPLNIPTFAGNLRGHVEESASLDPTHELTVQMWIRIDRFADDWMPVFINDSNGNGSTRTVTVWINRAGYFHFTSAAAGHDQNYMNVYPSEGHIQIDQWYHISGTIDRITGVQSFYINGQLAKTQSVRTGTIVHSTRGLRIGNTPETNGGYTAFYGAIADVRYFGRALPAEEIAAEYDSTTITDQTDLIAWYRMHEDRGSRLIDSSPNANHGVYRSGGKGGDRDIIEPARAVNTAVEALRVPVTEDDGNSSNSGDGSQQTPAAANPSDDLIVVYGEADNVVTFDGQTVVGFGDNSYAAVQHTEELVPRRQLTLSTWVYVDSLQRDWTPIIAKTDHGVRQRSYSLWMHSVGMFHFTSTAGGFDQDYIEMPHGSIQAGQWYHVAGVVDRDTGSMRLYVDGELRASRTNARREDIYRSTGPLVIGGVTHGTASRTTPDNNYRTFDGSIANVRLWDTALTQEQIQNDANRFIRSQGYSNLVVDLPLTKVEGNTAEDLSGNSHDATFRGSTTNYILPNDGLRTPEVRVNRAYPGLSAAHIPSLQLDSSSDRSSGESELTSHSSNDSVNTSQPLRGQSIWIGRPFGGDLVSLAEVIVRDTNGINIAPLGTATQSTTWQGNSGGRIAQVAIDRNADGDWYRNSVSATADGDPLPWWQLELPSEIDIQSIELYNRTDGAQVRLGNLQIIVRDGAGNITWRRNNDDFTGRIFEAFGLESDNSRSTNVDVSNVTGTVQALEVTILAGNVSGTPLLWSPDHRSVELELVPDTLNRYRPRTTLPEIETPNGRWQLQFETAPGSPEVSITEWQLRVESLNLAALVSDLPQVALYANVIDGREEFSIELQFRTPAAKSTVQTLFSSANEFSDNEFTVFLHSDGRIEVVDQGASTFWQMPFNAANNQWHHLTVIRRASNIDVVTGNGTALTAVTQHIATTSIDTAQPVRGKIVRIEKRFIDENILSLAEVVVRDSNGVNVAVLGTATQSTTRIGSGGNVASKANDGDTNGSWNHGSVTHTAPNQTDASAWWQVELPEEIDISRLEIFNRTDGSQSRLSNTRVLVLDANGNQVWSQDLDSVRSNHLSIYDVTSSNENLAVLDVDAADAVVRSVEVLVDTDARNWNGFLTGANGRIVALEVIPGTIDRLRPVNQNFADSIVTGQWALSAKSENVGTPIAITNWSLILETKAASATEANLQTATSTLAVTGQTDDHGQSLPITGLNVRLNIQDITGERNFTATLTSPAGTTVYLGDVKKHSLTDFNGEDSSGIWTVTLDTGTDAKSIKATLSNWEIDVLTSGSEILLGGHSMGTQLSAAAINADPSAAEPTKAIAATGRYIRLQTTTEGQLLALADVSVLDARGRHVAVFGTASQSGTGSQIASFATDTGATYADSWAIAEPDANGNAWWMLDLGRDIGISDIRITIPDVFKFGNIDVLTTMTQDDGTIDFRDTVPVHSTGLQAKYYNQSGSIGGFQNLYNKVPTLVRFDSQVNFGSTGSNFADTGYNTRYAVAWDGQIQIIEPGDTRFFINSDDGSRLYINGELLITNGGLHGMQERSGTVNLDVGYHDVRIEFFNNDGPGGMIFSYQPPGQGTSVVPAALLSTSSTDVFGEITQVVQSLTTTTEGLVGNLANIEVQATIDGSHFSISLVSPDGIRLPLTMVPRSANRFYAATLPAGTELNGSWTLTVAPTTATSDFTLSDFELLLTTEDSVSSQTTTTAFAAAVSLTDTTLKPLVVADGGFVLGQDQDRVASAFDARQSFVGQIDNVRIWDHAVTSEEASTLAGRKLSMIDDTTRLVASWNFNEVQGDDLLNSVAGGPAARIDGVNRAVRSAVDPYQSTAPQVLTLADQAVTLPYQTLNGQREFTLELQLRAAPGEMRTIGTFFSSAGSRTDNEFTLWMESGDRIGLNDAGPAYHWNLDQTIDDGQWHDISVVRQLVDDRLMVDLYVDGRFQGRRNVGNNTLRVSNRGIVLGQDQDSVGGRFDSNQSFRGDLDNIRIWHAVRTPEQIVAGRGGQISDPQFDETLVGYWTFNGFDANDFRDESASRRDAVNYTGSHKATRSTGGLGTIARSNSAESLDRTNHLLLTLANDVSLVGTPLFGDVNGDGHEDLLLHTTSTADPNSLLLISNVADWNADSQVAADNELATQILASGQTAFGVHTITDINADGFADVLSTTDNASKLPVLFGAADEVQVPKNFDVIANRTVTGSGDFVVDKGEAEQFDFEFTAADIQSNGRSQRWVRFTTLGDGYASSTSDINAGTWVRLSPSVRADLISADGSVAARNFWSLDLSRLPAGTYFLKVTSFAATEAAKFAITMRAPLAGTSWQPTDRDQIYAGEGDDWISGGAFKDIIFGNGADHAIDTVISEPLEFRDPDSVTIPARTITVGDQQIDLPAETILLEDRTNPAASETSTTPVTSSNPVRQLSELTDNQLSLLGNTNFAITLAADGSLQPTGTVREATLQNAERRARSISGRVFNDLNNDGVRGADEPWLNGMNVKLIDGNGQFVSTINTGEVDINGDGVIDPETERGWYAFAGLDVGDYRVLKSTQVGWAQTSPSKNGIAAPASVKVDGIESQSVDFGVRTLAAGSIAGEIFDDANNDGVRGEQEVPLSGWTVSLIDVASNKVAQTTTDDTGRYVFANLIPGNYFVVREFRDGWGPDVGQWEALRSLMMNRLGIITDPAHVALWNMTSPLILASRTGLWYAVTPDGRLLQGTSSDNAANGSLVRNIAGLMNTNQTMAESMLAMTNVFTAAARNVTVTEGLPTFVDLRSRELQPGSVVGSVFNDANSNAIQDSGEAPGSGVTVQLLNDDGSVAYTTTSDTNGNYSFGDMVVGSYYVSITPEEGWRQTLPIVDPVAHAAWDLDQELNLQHTGKYFENWGNLGEKWLHGSSGWYFITPDGAVYEWNNSPLDDLSGRYVVTLNPLYHQNPEMLFEAIPPGATRMQVAENQTTTVPVFLVTELPTANVSGSVYHDADSNGQRSSGERSLEGGTVDLLNTAGIIVETVFAGPHDVNGNNQIDDDEHGVYVFEEIPIGDYFVRINSTTDWTVTTPAETDAQHEALRLVATFQLQLASTSLSNSRGREEKWLTGIDHDQQAALFYILSTGEVVQWDGVEEGFLSGTTVGQVTPDFYENLSLLIDPRPQNAARIRTDSSSLLAGPTFGLTPSNEADIDTLMSVWHEQVEE